MKFIAYQIKRLMAQRIMVKTISRSDRPWSAIFCVIVYFYGIIRSWIRISTYSLRIRTVVKFCSHTLRLQYRCSADAFQCSIFLNWCFSNKNSLKKLMLINKLRFFISHCRLEFGSRIYMRTSLNPIRLGRGLRRPDDQIHSCHSETFYPMMPKLFDFKFLSLRHTLTKF